MSFFFFFFQAEDGIRDVAVTGVQTCALPLMRDPTPIHYWRRFELTASLTTWPRFTPCITAPAPVMMLGSFTPSPLQSRSEEHTSELQSRLHLVCRLLLEKKNTQQSSINGR